MPSISGNNKIVLKAGYTEGGAEHEEGILSGVASPGMNVVTTTAAQVFGRNTYAAGATPAGGTAAGAATPDIRIVKEDFLQGRTIADAFASGENIFLHQCKMGDIIQVLVKSGQTVTKGLLGSADGTGKWVVATINGVVEFLEASGGALGADTHMRARVL